MKILQTADDIYFTLLDGTGDILQVCKKKFMNRITKRRIKTIIKAKKSGELTLTEKRINQKKTGRFKKAIKV